MCSDSSKQDLIPLIMNDTGPLHVASEPDVGKIKIRIKAHVVF